jgi:hypothetical protein
MSKLAFTVFGQLPRKSNSRRIFRNPRTGRPIIVKSADALSYEKSFAFQVANVDKGKFEPKEPLCLSAHVWYQSGRSDLSIELFMDLLEKTGIIHNDRQIKIMHLWGHIDREFPRVEVLLERVEGKKECEI